MQAGQVTTPSLPVINGFGAFLEEESADELAARPGVASVTMNTDLARKRTPRLKGNAATRIPNPLTAIGRFGQPLQTTIGADKAWSRGVNGTGVGVAVVDTGVAGHIPDFMSGGQSRVIASAVTNPPRAGSTGHARASAA